MDGLLVGLLAALVLPVLLVGGLLRWFWRLSKVTDGTSDDQLPATQWLGLLAIACMACLVFYGWLDTLTQPIGSAHGPGPSAGARQQHHYDTIWWVLLLGVGFVLLLVTQPSRRRSARSFGAGLLLALGGVGIGWHLFLAHEDRVRQAHAAAAEQQRAANVQKLAGSFYGRKYGGTAIEPSSPEQTPTFPGGKPALLQAIQQRIKYPANAPEDQLDGEVVIEFIVEADGRLTFAHVFGGIGVACDKEALRVVNSLPPFIPGQSDGQPIATIWYASVPFRRYGAPVPSNSKHQRRRLH